MMPLYVCTWVLNFATKTQSFTFNFIIILACYAPIHCTYGTMNI